jgi:hypothetical protein
MYVIVFAQAFSPISILMIAKSVVIINLPSVLDLLSVSDTGKIPS